MAVFSPSRFAFEQHLRPRRVPMPRHRASAYGASGAADGHRDEDCRSCAAFPMARASPAVVRPSAPSRRRRTIRPVDVVDDDDHDVFRSRSRGDLFEQFGGAPEECLAHLPSSRGLPARDREEHEVVGARTSEIVAVEDQLARFVLMENLEAVGRRHVERLDHGAVDTVRKGAQVCSGDLPFRREMRTKGMEASCLNS